MRNAPLHGLDLPHFGFVPVWPVQRPDVAFESGVQKVDTVGALCDSTVSRGCFDRLCAETDSCHPQLD